VSAEIELDERGLALRWPRIGACEAIGVVCTTADATRHESTAWTRDGPDFSADCGPLQVQLRLTEEGEALLIALRAEAKVAAEVSGIGLTCRPLLDGVEPGWWIYNGYQSWDPSDVIPTSSTPQTSWWTAATAGPEGTGLALSSRTAKRLATRFDLTEGVLTMLQGPAKGAPPVAWRATPGDRLELEEVAVAGGANVWTSLRLVAGGSRRAVPVPLGWLSWYHYGPWVSQEDVLDNAGVLREGALGGLGYSVVQIDDGWQQAYGDWITNTKFGKGLATVAGRLTAWGQTPGVWTAPFLVSASADLATDAPEDWFIRDPESGERLIDPVHISFGPMYVLDARRPEVIAHLERVFESLFEAGIRYFKIDFLYAGAYGGVEALRAGVAAIRRAVKDSYILGCGAPLLPLAGMVEGCRIGQDTATPIYDFDSGKPLARIFGDEVLWIARNVAFRNHLDGWFQLDPDVALVGANLSLGQARQLVTAVALSGGPFFASDALAELEPARLALLTNPEVLGLVGGSPAVPDWEPHSDKLAGIWRRGDDLVAAFNWNGPPRRLTVETDGATRVRDLWQRAELSLGGTVAELELGEAGVRLLKLEGGGRLRAWLE
jgi:alpha-galactosidase